jgi:hypothetical protein
MSNNITTLMSGRILRAPKRISVECIKVKVKRTVTCNFFTDHKAARFIPTFVSYIIGMTMHEILSMFQNKLLDLHK